MVDECNYGNKVKWFPGHYLRKIIGSDNQNNNADLTGNEKTFLGNEYTEGLTVFLNWKDLEPKKNQYDFSVIDKLIESVSEYDKKIMIIVLNRCFNGCTDANSPAYLRTDPSYNGGVEPYIERSTGKQKGSVARVWDSVVNDRYISLFKAMGKKYNNNHAVAGVAPSGESAIAIVKTEALGYTNDNYKAEIIRIAAEAKKAFPNTIVFTGMNFIDGDEPEMTRIAKEIEKIGGSGIVNPDTLPHKDFPVYGTYRKMKGKIAVFTQFQAPGLLPDTTEENMYKFAVNDLGCNFITWNHWVADRPNYPTNYALPVVNKYKGAINAGCPSSFKGCTSQCEEPDTGKPSNDDWQAMYEELNGKFESFKTDLKASIESLLKKL